ncbi:MAG: Uma2 family endonuclease [Chloroflexota bacterium]
MAYVLKRTGKYTVSVELSLDSSSLDKDIYNVTDELIPDICIYPKRQLVKADDIMKMTDMPLMVVEVLSFRQITSSLVEKFRAYFALGVQSCWLVDPVTQTVHVYSSNDQWRSFSMTDELVDEVLDIRVAVAELFES